MTFANFEHPDLVTPLWYLFNPPIFHKKGSEEPMRLIYTPSVIFFYKVKAERSENRTFIVKNILLICHVLDNVPHSSLCNILTIHPIPINISGDVSSICKSMEKTPIVS